MTIRPIEPKNTLSVMAIIRITCAIIFIASGVLGSLKLKMTGVISEPSFDLFILVSVAVSLFISFPNRFRSFEVQAGKLKIEFEKVEAARKEVEQREQSVRRTAMILAQIAVFIGAFGNRAKSEKMKKLKPLGSFKRQIAFCLKFPRQKMKK